MISRHEILNQIEEALHDWDYKYKDYISKDKELCIELTIINPWWVEWEEDILSLLWEVADRYGEGADVYLDNNIFHIRFEPY